VFIQIAFWVIIEKGKDFPLFPQKLPLNGRIFLSFAKNQLVNDH